MVSKIALFRWHSFFLPLRHPETCELPRRHSLTHTQTLSRAAGRVGQPKRHHRRRIARSQDVRRSVPKAPAGGGQVDPRLPALDIARIGGHRAAGWTQGIGGWELWWNHRPVVIVEARPDGSVRVVLAQHAPSTQNSYFSLRWMKASRPPSRMMAT